MAFLKTLQTIISGQDLTELEMIDSMTQIMEGKVSDTQLAAFLTALQTKKETVPEIVGAARVMRGKAEKVKVNASHIVDTCGTGGDGSDTFNIS
ncbi:MAG: anthranilate phosphoribosyltransferase, partial [Nitrospina sp.]|nr:anthranilate phosphoribosyltransferase [Nitrospina sp.]